MAQTIQASPNNTRKLQDTMLEISDRPLAKLFAHLDPYIGNFEQTMSF